ncbi:LysR family transcriptional regulator [Roseobacter litoralis]|uniref:LysR family transcriptional regulator n=1 Tax=Roseobacter litoralis TaxID=42443 RepID=UPI00248FB3ED|nr:LysR family transcriptional regulator [Roseobacter litoralis]
MRNFDTSSIDGRLLKVFLTVYEEKSVTKAASTLGTSQSTISHSLEKLRQCVGDPLFVKSGRGITPTNVATAIAPKISWIIGELEGLALQSEYSPQKDTTTFTIATNVTELLPVLIPVKRVIRRAAPNVMIRFTDLGARTNALSVLANGLADVAITAAVGPYPLELAIDHYYKDDFVCFFDAARRNAPDTIEAYSAARHAVLDFGGTTKSIVDATLENAGHTRQIFLAAANSYALAKLAFGTDLVATLPKRLRATAFTGFSHVTPPFPLPPVTYDLVWHRRTLDSSRHKWLKKVMMNAISDFDAK